MAFPNRFNIRVDLLGFYPPVLKIRGAGCGEAESRSTLGLGDQYASTTQSISESLMPPFSNSINLLSILLPSRKYQSHATIQQKTHLSRMTVYYSDNPPPPSRLVDGSCVWWADNTGLYRRILLAYFELKKSISLGFIRSRQLSCD